MYLYWFTIAGIYVKFKKTFTGKNRFEKIFLFLRVLIFYLVKGSHFFPSVPPADCCVGKLWDNSPYFLLQSCRPFRYTDDKILRLLRLRHKKENYSDRTSKNKAFKSLNSKKGTSCEHFRTSEISSNLKRVKVT
jgi:hypothetical protein